MKLQNLSHVYTRPSAGLLNAEALLAATNDLSGGHPISAQNLVALSQHVTLGMLNEMYGLIANPSVTAGEAGSEVANYSIYGPYTAYEAQPMQPLTLAEAEAAVQIVGSTVGWHFWG